MDISRLTIHAERPKVFMQYKGVTVFHILKAQSDRQLIFWYTTSPERENAQFRLNELFDKLHPDWTLLNSQRAIDFSQKELLSEFYAVMRAAIDAGLVVAGDLPPWEVQ